jgi:hypothetical protein
MQITPTIQAEFNEQITLFFDRAKSKAEGEKQLVKHCNEMLEQLPQMLPLLAEYPAYGAMAFYGKMQVGDRKLITQLAANRTPAEVAIATVREKKALKIAASAKAGWDFLLQNDQSALWGAIQLNSLTPKRSSAPVQDDDEDEDDDGYNDEEDDTDDNE